MLADRITPMRTTKAWRWIAAAALLLLYVAPVHALRCNGRIVEEGDHAYELKKRCGEPYWVEHYSEWLVLGEGSRLEQQIERSLEAWYYNFGPNKLLRRMVLRDNRIVREDTLGYGYSRLGQNCDLDALAPGMSNGEIVARCGTPAAQDTRYANEIVRDRGGVARQRAIRREEWVYETPGRDHHLLILIDGTLSRVERLDR